MSQNPEFYVRPSFSHPEKFDIVAIVRFPATNLTSYMMVARQLDESVARVIFRNIPGMSFLEARKSAAKTLNRYRGIAYRFRALFV